MIEYLLNILSYAVPFILVFTTVVFIHELGHFVVARWNGVFVETFSIGMGKEIYARTDKFGTKWRIALFPVGGYCKMRGEEEDGTGDSTPAESPPVGSAEWKAGSYDSKTPYARIAIASAGPIANFLLAIAIFWGVFFIIGVRESQTVISLVKEGTPAAAAGFQVGDRVLSINDEPIKTSGKISQWTSLSVGEALQVKVQRGDEIKSLIVVPQLGEIQDSFGGTQRTGAIGVGLREEEVSLKPLGIVSSLGAAVERVGIVIKATFSYLGQLVVGKQDSSQLSGPIRIVKLTGDFFERGLLPLILLAAMLSISLGIINLFPVPVLDGGRIIFYAIEAVKGSPLSKRIEANAMRVGLVMILFLMVFVTINDIVHLGWFSAG